MFDRLGACFRYSLVDFGLAQRYDPSEVKAKQEKAEEQSKLPRNRKLFKTPRKKRTRQTDSHSTECTAKKHACPKEATGQEGQTGQEVGHVNNSLQELQNISLAAAGCNEAVKPEKPSKVVASAKAKSKENATGGAAAGGAGGSATRAQRKLLSPRRHVLEKRTHTRLRSDERRTHVKGVTSHVRHNTASPTLVRSKSLASLSQQHGSSRPRPASKCECFGRLIVCSICNARPSQHAARAGTPGFRAPEVLLKYPHQTTGQFREHRNSLICMYMTSGTCIRQNALDRYEVTFLIAFV